MRYRGSIEAPKHKDPGFGAEGRLYGGGGRLHVGSFPSNPNPKALRRFLGL